MSHAHLTRWSSKPDLYTGLWGPVTSSIDWCEANYAQSLYLAEFWNSLTNIFFVALAGYAAKKTRDEGLELRYTVTYLLVVMVGLGSFLFHATLQHIWQLADELPMLTVVAHNLYCVSETGKRGQPRGGLLLPLSLFMAFLIPSIIYVLYQNPIFHQVAYGCLLTMGVARTTYLLLTKFGKSAREAEQRRTCQRLLIAGLAQSALAFLVWNIDNWFCDQLDPLKDALGFPLNGLLEGHGWWHILCASGAVFMMAGCQLTALCVREGVDVYAVDYALGMPYLHRRTYASSKAE